MSTRLCISCRRPKANLQCDLCQEDLCRDCDQFLAEGSFSFLRNIPQALTHAHYCPACHGSQVEPALEAYEETMERARGLYFFYSTQKRLLPVLGRAQERVTVENCEDRNETILRLAFFAAELGYNAVTEAEVGSQKIRNEGYQKTLWRGSGIPTNVDAEKLERIARGR